MNAVIISNETEGRGRLMTMEGLSENQKKRMSTNTLAVLLFIGYLMLGVVFYCYSRSQYTPLDAIYFSVITFTTVGYGDTPVINRPFTTFFVLLGAGLVGSFFGIFSNDVMEYHEQAMKRKLVQTALNMNKVVNKTTNTLRKYKEKTISHYLKEEELQSNPTFRQRLSRMFVEQLHSDTSGQLKDMNMAIYEDELREVRSKGLVDGMFVVVSMFVGAVCMMTLEGWTFDEAIYWAVVTMTTVGYGDVTPTTSGGKIFTIVYTLVGCSLAAKGFRDVVTYPMIVKAKENELFITRQFGDELSESTLSNLLQNDFFNRIPNLRRDNKQIQKSEFVLLLLRMMGKVEDKDILLASKIFDKLDSECDGVLSEEDQKEEIRKARERDVARVLEAQRRAQELEQQQQNAQGKGLFGFMTGTGGGSGTGGFSSPVRHGSVSSVHSNTYSSRLRGFSGVGATAASHVDDEHVELAENPLNALRGRSDYPLSRDADFVETATGAASIDNSRAGTSSSTRSGAGVNSSLDPMAVQATSSTIGGSKRRQPLQSSGQSSIPSSSSSSASAGGGRFSPIRGGVSVSASNSSSNNNNGGTGRRVSGAAVRPNSASLSEQEDEEDDDDDVAADMAVSSMLKDLLAADRNVSWGTDTAYSPAPTASTSGGSASATPDGLGGEYVTVARQQQQQQAQKHSTKTLLSVVDKHGSSSSNNSSSGDDLV